MKLQPRRREKARLLRSGTSIDRLDTMLNKIPHANSSPVQGLPIGCRCSKSFHMRKTSESRRYRELQVFQVIHLKGYRLVLCLSAGVGCLAESRLVLLWFFSPQFVKALHYPLVKALHYPRTGRHRLHFGPSTSAAHRPTHPRVKLMRKIASQLLWNGEGWALWHGVVLKVGERRDLGTVDPVEVYCISFTVLGFGRMFSQGLQSTPC